MPSNKRKHPVIDEDEYDEDRSNDDDDEAGSLNDFIADDDVDGSESGESEGPQTEQEARARDLDGINASNILEGKRTRRSTKFYEQEVFATEEYRRMMLEDVPEDEMHALEDSDEEEESDEEDGEYEDAEDGVTTEEESDDEEDAPPSSMMGGTKPGASN